MNWYNSEQMQEIANNTGRLQFGWMPKYFIYINCLPLWIRDTNGRVRDYSNKNPNSKDTDPWENKHSYMKMWRPS